jgi:MerR HTH family regulatory protein
MTDVNLCVVCRWRELDEYEPQVCHWCKGRMAGQLRLIERGTPLLEVVARAEPTGDGQLNLFAVDLATPGNPAYFRGRRDPGSQTGQVPVAMRLARWAEDWSGRDIITADAASVAGLLRKGLTWACVSHPQIDDFARELRQVYMAIRVGLRRVEVSRRYAASCRWCGQRTLVRNPGADWIECEDPWCGALYDSENYAEMVVAELARAARGHWAAYRPMTTREAAALAGVKPTVIRQWISRGKLRPDIGPWGGRRFLRVDVDRAQAEIEDRERALAAREHERVAA